MYGGEQACIRTLERVVLRTLIRPRPDLCRSSAQCQGFYTSQRKNRESGTDSTTKAYRNAVMKGLNVVMRERERRRYITDYAKRFIEVLYCVFLMGFAVASLGTGADADDCAVG